jgi:hypothetical protein
MADKNFPGAMLTTRCILSKQAYIDGEDLREFNRIRRNMMAEDQPHSEWETLQVGRMVACIWKLRRIQASEVELLNTVFFNSTNWQHLSYADIKSVRHHMGEEVDIDAME